MSGGSHGLSCIPQGVQDRRIPRRVGCAIQRQLNSKGMDSGAECTYFPTILILGADLLFRWDPISQQWRLHIWVVSQIRANVWQGRRRSLCISRKCALPTVFLNEGPELSIGNRHTGAPVALDPPLHISPSGADSAHIGDFAPGGLVVDSCGSLLTQATLVCGD